MADSTSSHSNKDDEEPERKVVSSLQEEQDARMSSVVEQSQQDRDAVAARDGPRIDAFETVDDNNTQELINSEAPPAGDAKAGAPIGEQVESSGERSRSSTPRRPRPSDVEEQQRVEGDDRALARVRLDTGKNFLKADLHC